MEVSGAVANAPMRQRIPDNDKPVDDGPGLFEADFAKVGTAALFGLVGGGMTLAWRAGMASDASEAVLRGREVIPISHRASAGWVLGLGAAATAVGWLAGPGIQSHGDIPDRRISGYARDIFESYDHNGDGEVQLKARPTRPALDERFSSSNRKIMDGEGVLSPYEVARMDADGNGTFIQGDVEQYLFRTVDENKDGWIDGHAEKQTLGNTRGDRMKVRVDDADAAINRARSKAALSPEQQIAKLRLEKNEKMDSRQTNWRAGVAIPGILVGAVAGEMLFVAATKNWSTAEKLSRMSMTSLLGPAVGGMVAGGWLGNMAGGAIGKNAARDVGARYDQQVADVETQFGQR